MGIDPQSIIEGAGAWGLLIVCAIVFAESGLLVGFFLPGDTLLFSRRDVDRTQGFFDRFGSWAVTLARFVPVVRTFAPVAAGVGRMRYARFAAFTAIGVADVVGRYMDVVLVGIAVLSVGGILLTLLRQRRRAEGHAAGDRGTGRPGAGS